MRLIEELIYRVFLGYYYIYIDNIQYKVIYPDLKIKYEAQLLYNKIIEENKYDKRWLTPEEIKAYLLQNHLWDLSKDKELEQAHKTLEDLKVDLYLNYINETKKKTIKNRILAVNKSINESTILKNSMNHLGIEEHAFSIKNEFIIMNTIYLNNNLYFIDPSKDNHNSIELNSFIHEIVNNNISPSTLRSIAKSDLWKSYSQLNSINNCDFITINDDMKHLLGLNRMYDNVKQHPECPSDAIIDDDDALDGWFIYQNRKIDKEKKKNAVLDKFGGNIKNAGEVFLLTTDLNETKEIFDLNDETSRRNIKEIRQVASSNKDTLWQDLSFVRQDIKQQALSASNKGKPK